MKIAYFSPLNPQKSGISDFSEEWLTQFVDIRNEVGMDIDIFTSKPITNVYLKEKFTVRRIDEMDESISERYPIKIYHIGNNTEAHEQIVEKFFRFSGILEIHDISLHNMVVGMTVAKNNIADYLKLIDYSHGKRGLNIAKDYFKKGGEMPWERDSLEMTMNKHLIDKAQAVIVHSDFAKQMVKAVNQDVPVITIPLHTVDIIDNCQKDRESAKKRLKINDKRLIFASFGFATPTKRIISILKALKKFKKKNSFFLYIIVGEVRDKKINSAIRNFNLSENVIVTGYTSLDVFKDYMLACDVAINLRYPTQGESSAAVHRLLGMGKPIIVTDIGAFQEYLDNVVIKVRFDDHEVDDIYKALCTLTNDEKLREQYSQNAIAYAKENFYLKNNILIYCDFISKIINNTYKESDYMDMLLDNIDRSLYFDTEYINSIIVDIL